MSREQSGQLGQRNYFDHRDNNNNHNQVVRELLKFDLHKALKGIFPKASNQFLMSEISQFCLRLDRDNGRTMDESQILTALTDRLLGVNIPEEEVSLLTIPAANLPLLSASVREPRLVNINVLPQSVDTVEKNLREELLDALMRKFPMAKKDFLLGQIEQVMRNLGDEHRKLETLINRVVELSFIPKDNKMGLKIFDATATVPEDVLFPQPVTTSGEKSSAHLSSRITFDCGCCFNNISSSSRVTCAEKHEFCQECIKRLVDFIISGEGSSSFVCLAEGCDSVFPKSQLQFLDPNQLRRLEERQQSEEISKAMASFGDEQLHQCPSCDFRCLIPEGNKVFECYNPKCMKESCKVCKKDWELHFGLPCDQVELKDESELRIRTEEAMTQALVRRCHVCNTPFLKEKGCNKMTCRCGAKQCYICRQPVKDCKTHFCQHVTFDSKCRRCSKCFLFDENVDKKDQEKVEEERQRGVEQLIVSGLSVKNQTIFKEADLNSAIAACSRKRKAPDECERSGENKRIHPSMVPAMTETVSSTSSGVVPFNNNVNNINNNNNNSHCLHCGQPGHIRRFCAVISCFKCGDQGHIATDCPQSHYRPMICYNCQEEGHMALDCPEGGGPEGGWGFGGASSSSSNTSSSSSSSGVVPFNNNDNIQCFHCGQPGHTSRVCVNRSCFKCGEPGHIAVDCPQPHYRPIFCSHCNEEGHVARDCPECDLQCYRCLGYGHIAIDCDETDYDSQ